MAEIRTVTTLRAKQEEIVHSIRLYEQQLAQARADLAHVTAAIRIFEAAGEPKDMPRYVDTYRLFKRGEQWTICQAALTECGPLTTTELTVAVMKAKGLDPTDKVLSRGVSSRIIHMLRMRAMTGRLEMAGKRHGRSVWKAVTAK